MSITKILSNEKTSDEEKIASIAELVAKARESYGNEDAVISDPIVNTAFGEMRFGNLENDSKLQAVRNEVSKIKVMACEAVEQGQGVNPNRRVEELIATNPILVNVSSGTKFEYL
jgi:Golgi nucleoside diphosphatase